MMKRIISVLIIIILLFSFALAEPAPVTSVAPATNTATTAVPAIETAKLTVHFLDVGQADNILIQLPNKQTALIDGGNAADTELITKYIKDLNITKIDYLIGTHPHEDHIGGLAAIVNTFDIDKIYMPKVTHTSEIYKNLLLTIKDKKLTIQAPVPSSNIIDEPDLKFTILAPNSAEYKELNNYSIVTKLTYKKNSFLFTGDAEKISEDEMLLKEYELKVDVLKVAHHGSTTSTSPSFAKAVSPKYSLISVGKDNKFNHPDNIVINRLKLYGEVHRTDLDGIIIATSDGEKIILAYKKVSEVMTPLIINKVFVTQTGTKYHKEGCSYLKDSMIEISLEDAKKKGLEPCSKCMK